MPVIITHPETHATSNLQRGDLVFKNCEGSLEVGKVIQAGQFLSSLFGQAQIKDSKWEHAAVAINGEGSLIEAVSGGITVNDMTRGADYIVFRCTNPAVQNVAANAAQMFLENKLEAEDEGSQIFGYSLKKAIKAWANPGRAVPDVDSVRGTDRQSVSTPGSRPSCRRSAGYVLLAICRAVLCGAEQKRLASRCLYRAPGSCADPGPDGHPAAQ